MSKADPFFAKAAATYEKANAETMRWMLARPVLHGAFVNTKVNSITLKDYGPEDGWRGPDYTYCWIQGRALEAICLHQADIQRHDRALARTLADAESRLFSALEALVAPTGHAYFAYDADLKPVRPGPDGAPMAQATPEDIYTYSDAFVAKGLHLAALRRGANAAGHRAYLDRVIASIPAGRFQMDEKALLGAATIAVQADDFGPRMILLGAASVVATIYETPALPYAEDFIAHVLDRHFDRGTGLLRNVPGQDACNVGHGLEFVGFVLEYLGERSEPALVAQLEHILIASFEAGFTGPGIRLAVSAATKQPLSPYCPWWSLPEAIRAAALVHARTASRASLEIWKRAHEAFFAHYWRPGTGLAYQTMTAEGPVDFVPATPDLDPGYHTGLSLLTAARTARALASRPFRSFLPFS